MSNINDNKIKMYLQSASKYREKKTGIIGYRLKYSNGLDVKIVEHVVTDDEEVFSFPSRINSMAE